MNGPEDATSTGTPLTGRSTRTTYGGYGSGSSRRSQDGDLAKARNLQKMMLRSWWNTLVSVRQATQRNAGRKTAGIDGQVALTSPARMELAVQAHRAVRSWKPRAVKRVYIPKAGNRAKQRPLGIPVITDRCPPGQGP